MRCGAALLLLLPRYFRVLSLSRSVAEKRQREKTSLFCSLRRNIVWERHISYFSLKYYSTVFVSFSNQAQIDLIFIIALRRNRKEEGNKKERLIIAQSVPGVTKNKSNGRLVVIAALYLDCGNHFNNMGPITFDFFSFLSLSGLLQHSDA